MNKALLSILFLFLLSCKNEKTFIVEIENKSRYKIDKLNIGCAIEEKIIEINPLGKILTELKLEQSTSQVIISKTFKNPEFCITVLEYSDSNGQYKNSIGDAIEIDRFKEQIINKIEIEYSSEGKFLSKVKLCDKE